MCVYIQFASRGNSREYGMTLFTVELIVGLAGESNKLGSIQNDCLTLEYG